LAVSQAHAADPSNFGVTGLLSIPSAEVLHEGAAAAGFNRHNQNPGLSAEVENYFVNIGFFPGFEAAGRLVEGTFLPGVTSRDLSFDLKYQFWAVPNGPRFALGVQDAGGEIRFFRSKYAVATWPWPSFSASLGYGAGPDALDGVFGGFEWSPWTFLSVLADHNASDINAGLRLSSGDRLGRWKLALTTVYNGANEEIESGLTLRFPLGLNDSISFPQNSVRRDSTPAPAPSALLPAKQEFPPAASEPEMVVTPGTTALQALSESLVRLGFESVRVGLRPNATVVMVIENRVYNHSFVDAAGAALGSASALVGATARAVELVLTSYGVPQLVITVPMARYRDFLAGGDQQALLRDWQVRYTDSIPNPYEVDWLDTAAPMRSIELVLEPLLRTFVGTEFGVLDYAVGLRLSTVLPLAPGLLLTSGYQAEGAESDDFRRPDVFKGFGIEPGLDHFLLQYFHKPAAQWASLWSVGLTQIFKADLRVAGLEQLWLSEQGRHQLRAKLMILGTRSDYRKVALGGYTWFNADRRYALSATAGQFYGGENGFRLNANRYFGDTLFGFYLRYASRTEQLVGFEFSLPLTPRRDMTPDGVQLKGPRRWAYGLATTVNAADGRNPLRPIFMLEPQLDLDLRRDFFDGARLTPDQLQFNTGRLREADALWSER
jgi:hypothetical protein